MQQFRPAGFSVLPEVVKNLLIVNAIMLLATFVLQNRFQVDLNDMLGLHWIGSEKFAFYQVVTYMFMHGGFSHFFFNMFAVWMFGSAIENTWGPKRFLIFYLLTGIGAALTHYVIIYFGEIGPAIEYINAVIADPNSSTLLAFREHVGFQFRSENTFIYSDFQDSMGALNAVLNDAANSTQLEQVKFFMNDYKAYFLNLPNVVGASGSLFGVLLAFGMLFPNTRLFLLFFPFPIKAKYFVIGYGALELYNGVYNTSDGVAHFAHLGGMLFGYLLIMYWRKRQFDQFREF